MGRRERRESQIVEETGLTPEELQILGTYNAEAARGLVHSARWKSYMRELQQRFDADQEGGVKEDPEDTSLPPAKLKILRILSDRGEFRDNDGRAVSLLKELTGHGSTNILSNHLAQMEDGGLIERWVAGRRTYSIRITPAGMQAARIDRNPDG